MKPPPVCAHGAVARTREWVRLARSSRSRSARKRPVLAQLTVQTWRLPPGVSSAWTNSVMPRGTRGDMTIGDVRTVISARLVNGAFIGMYCAGLLLRTPWLAQTICWAVLLPSAIWLVFDRPSSVPGARPRPLYWLIVCGLAAYLACLIVATIAGGLQWERLPKQIFGAALCLTTVAAVGEASRYDPYFPRTLGRAISLAAGVAALLLLGTSFLDGSLVNGRLGGQPSINWVLNPNAVAAVYAISFAVVAGHGLRHDIRKLERVLAALIALLLLVVVVLTQSRSAMMGCLGVIGIVLLASSRPVRFCLGALAIAAVAAVMLIFPGWGASALLARGDSHRLALWGHFLQLSALNPWLGFGLNFDPRFRLGAEVIYTPHDIFVAALIRGGRLALVSLAIILGAAAWAVATAARGGWWLPITVLVAALGLSSVDHEMIPGTFSYYWYVFWLPLALAAAAGAIASDPSFRDRYRKAASDAASGVAAQTASPQEHL